MSNFLVGRIGRSKLSFSASRMTEFSGRRNAKFKTHFPSLLELILNCYLPLLLHILPKNFKNFKKILGIYFNAKLTSGAISE